MWLDALASEPDPVAALIRHPGAPCRAVVPVLARCSGRPGAARLRYSPSKEWSSVTSRVLARRRSERVLPEVARLVAAILPPAADGSSPGVAATSLLIPREQRVRVGSAQHPQGRCEPWMKTAERSP